MTLTDVPGRVRGREAGDRQRLGRRRLHRDARLARREACVAVSVAVIDCVPGRLERDREAMRARVGGGEGVVRRQNGMARRCW